MSVRTRILAGVALVVLLVLAWFRVSEGDDRTIHTLFTQHTELFVAIQEEAEQVMSGDAGENPRKNGVTTLYSTGGNASVDQFDDRMTTSLKRNLRELDGWSERKLSMVWYNVQEGKRLVQFIFDWESAYGKPYHIVYSESRDILVHTYDKEPVKYVLHKLKLENWYRVAFTDR